MRLMHLMTSAALFALTATVLPDISTAGDLLSGTAGIGGGSLADAHVNANVGGLNAQVGAKVGSTTNVTAAVGTEARPGNVVDARIDANLGASSLSSPAARAGAAKTVAVRAEVLSPRRLLTLCINVGGKGCSGASRHQQLAIVKAKLRLLTGAELVSACVAVGGGCGGAGNGGGGGGNPGGGNGGGGGSGGSGSGSGGGSTGLNLASADTKDRDTVITCRSILASPARYDTGLVTLCRKVVQ